MFQLINDISLTQRTFTEDVIFAITSQFKLSAAVVSASIDGKCLDAQYGFLVTVDINLELDFAIVVLPFSIIWHLQLLIRERL